MQTFDVLSSASHTAPTRDNPVNPSGEKPAPNGEKFGDVMDRALNDPPRKWNRNDRGPQACGQPPAQNAADPTATQQPKDTARSKKAVRHEAKKDGAETPQPPKENVAATPLPQPIEKTVEEQMILGDKGVSDIATAVDSGPDKGQHPTIAGNTDSTPASTPLQFLTVAGLPLAIPSATPTVRSHVKSGVSGEAKASSSPVASVPVKSGVSSASVADIVDPKDRTEPVPGSLGEPTAQKPDARSEKTNGLSDDSKNAPIANNGVGQDNTLRLTEPRPDKADTAQPLTIPLPDLPGPVSAKAKTSSSDASAPALEDISGTSAAKQDIAMKKADKTTKVAGQAEQDLPSGTASANTDLPAASKSSGNSPSEGNGKLETPTGIDLPPTRVVTPTESITPTATSTTVSPAATVDTRVLERTHDIVALHAMRLRETGSDSLHVVVKPGAGIQLSLELRQNDAGIEVRASLHKGDFEHLSQYWPELQQRMEARGVRVGSLTCSENFLGSSQQQSQQSKQQTSNQDPLAAGAFAEFALAGSLSEAPATRAARATAYRGWETWA